MENCRHHREGRNQSSAHSSHSRNWATGKSNSNQQPQFSQSGQFHRSGNDSYNSKDAGGLKITSRVQEDVDTAESSNGPSIIGTCPFMCPESERRRREQLRDISVFERLHGNPGKSSTDLAVKKFCRTISTKDLDACDIRPMSVLEETLKYLMSLLDQSDLPFETVHDFIFDRTRSIRQDLSMQNIVNVKAIHIYEEIGESLALWFRQLSTSVMWSKELNFSREILKSFHLGNYRRFLCTTASEASYLQYCILEPYISEIRAMALCFINSTGYKLHPFPLANLSQVLLMKEPELESLCKLCGLETTEDETGNKSLPLKQTTFCRPKGDLGSYNLLGCNFFEE